MLKMLNIQNRVYNQRYYLIALLLLIAACLCTLAAWRFSSMALQFIALLFAAIVLLLLALGACILPTAQRFQVTLQTQNKERFEEVREMLRQAEKSVKEYRRARVAIDALRESVAAERKPLDAMAQELQTGLFHYHALEEDLQQTRQQQASCAHQLAAWAETAIQYFEYLQRLLAQMPEEDPGSHLLQQAADTFARYCEARGLDRINPLPGDPVLPGLHQIVGEVASLHLPDGVVCRCESWGYRRGASVMAPAKIMITRSTDGATW